MTINLRYYEISQIYMNEVYLQIFHRIAFVLGIIPALVLMIIPNIFTDEKDLEFATKTKTYLIYITRTALFLSLITGILRIQTPLHFGLTIKILLGIVSILSFFLKDVDITHPKYQISMIIRVSLLFITALVGLSI